MSSSDGTSVMEFDGALCAERRRGFGPAIGLSVAATGSVLLWAALALALRWAAQTFL